MRTTVTLHDDLFAKLKDDAHERGVSFKRAINDAVRAGLQPGPSASEPYRIQPRNMGTLPGVNLDKALQLAAEMEDEATLREMHAGK